MLFQIMTETEMVEYLGNLRDLEANIIYERDMLKGQVELLEEAIERISLSGNKVPGSMWRGVDGRDKIYHLLMNAYDSIGNQIDDVIKEIWEVEKKERQLRSIKMCLARLSFSQRELVEDLYINRINWQDYAKKHFLSRATIFRKRKKAIEDLVRIYNTTYSTNKLNEEKRNV